MQLRMSTYTTPCTSNESALSVSTLTRDPTLPIHVHQGGLQRSCSDPCKDYSPCQDLRCSSLDQHLRHNEKMGCRIHSSSQTWLDSWGHYRRSWIPASATMDPSPLVGSLLIVGFVLLISVSESICHGSVTMIRFCFRCIQEKDDDSMAEDCLQVEIS
jgi:hypothetical protein